MVSMLSLVKHLAMPAQCVIHLIVDKLDIGIAKRLVKCFRHEIDYHFQRSQQPEVLLHTLKRPIPDLRGQFFDGTGYRNQHYYEFFEESPFIYVKFHLADYLPAQLRALWIDSDVVVKADVAPLYRMHMHHPIAATPCPKSFGWPFFMAMVAHGDYRLARSAHQDHSLPPMQTGILVIDIQKWRDRNISKSLQNWTEKFQGVWWELLPMSTEFQGSYDIIDWRWQVDGLGQLSYVPPLCLKSAKLLHYSGVFKPWGRTKDENSFVDIWKSYAPTHPCSASNATMRPSGAAWSVQWSDR
jgi:lipopolysaccharide biosynthesis glycosyltransferase